LKYLSSFKFLDYYYYLFSSEVWHILDCSLAFTDLGFRPLFP